MDARERKLVAKARAFITHNCCGDPCDIIGGIKASVKREELGKLVYRKSPGSKDELFYVSKARAAAKLGELELTEEQLQRLIEPKIFEVMGDNKT